MPKKRHTMNDNMIAKGHIDVVDLAKRVCDILGVQVHYSSNSNQLWLSRCGTDDEVSCVFGHMSDMPDMPEMLPASFNATRVDDDIVSSYSFIDRLRLIRKFHYGMDIRTFNSVKVIDNPFFMLKTLEEIAMKCDLLV